MGLHHVSSRYEYWIIKIKSQFRSGIKLKRSNKMNVQFNNVMLATKLWGWIVSAGQTKTNRRKYVFDE